MLPMITIKKVGRKCNIVTKDHQTLLLGLSGLLPSKFYRGPRIISLEIFFKAKMGLSVIQFCIVFTKSLFHSADLSYLPFKSSNCYLL